MKRKIKEKLTSLQKGEALTVHSEIYEYMLLYVNMMDRGSELT